MPESDSDLLVRNEDDLPLALGQGKHLLRTKFYIPPVRSNQIARPRLFDLMNTGLDRALILLSAPAGYGKTTLVSGWLQGIPIPSAWLSLDSGDNDPTRLFQYLFGTLIPLVPGIGDDLSGMIQAVPPVPFEALINSLVNGLASFSGPLVLVLDRKSVV
jgi:LuxR family transcriptional regulator, maltose regulon positive regulatory protein